MIQGLTREKLPDGEAVMLALFAQQWKRMNLLRKESLTRLRKFRSPPAELTEAEARRSKPNAIFKRLDQNWYLYARYNE